MEAGAPGRPTADESVRAAATGRRTEGANPLTPGSQYARRPDTLEGVTGRLFLSRISSDTYSALLVQRSSAIRSHFRKPGNDVSASRAGCICGFISLAGNRWRTELA